MTARNDGLHAGSYSPSAGILVRAVGPGQPPGAWPPSLVNTADEVERAVRAVGEISGWRAGQAAMARPTRWGRANRKSA